MNNQHAQKKEQQYKRYIFHLSKEIEPLFQDYSHEEVAQLMTEEHNQRVILDVFHVLGLKGVVVE
jgi:hypothetical protein